MDELFGSGFLDFRNGGYSPCPWKIDFTQGSNEQNDEGSRNY